MPTTEVLSNDNGIDFGRLSGHIEAALAYTGDPPTHTLEDIRDAVADGRLQMWPTENSVVFTEILQYPRKRVLNFFLAGGNLDDMKALQPIILEWGRSQGCDVATFIGRPGWSRTFLTRADGWSPTMLVFEREL